MTAELVSVSAIASEVGWPRRRLVTFLRRRESDLKQKERPVQLVFGDGGRGSKYRVNRSQIEIHCPELFEAKPPEEALKVLREHLTDTTQRIEGWEDELDEFRTELGQQAEATVTLCEELHELVDTQSITIAMLYQMVLSLEAKVGGKVGDQMRPNETSSFAMDEGDGFSLSGKLRKHQTEGTADYGPSSTTNTSATSPSGQAPHH